jgi:hypothetical protein
VELCRTGPCHSFRQLFFLRCLFKVFQSAKGEKDFWLSIHTSKDPTTFTVLFEDSAALLGLIVAFFGVFLAHVFDNPYFDGAASIVIGIILALVAVLRAYETEGLLVGEGADPETIKNIRRQAESDPCVQRVSDIPTQCILARTASCSRWICGFAAAFPPPKWKKPSIGLKRPFGHAIRHVKHGFIEFDSVPAKRV